MPSGIEEHTDDTPKRPYPRPGGREPDTGDRDEKGLEAYNKMVERYKEKRTDE